MDGNKAKDEEDGQPSCGIFSPLVASRQILQRLG